MRTKTSRMGQCSDFSSRRSACQSGFTLVELLLVVAIIALSASVFLSMAPSSGQGVKLKVIAHDIASVFREARINAVSRRSQQLVLIDTRRKTVTHTGTGKFQTVTAKIGLNVVSAQSERISHEIVGVRFFPNGSSTGAKLTLFHGGHGYEVNIGWLAGLIDTISLP